MLQSTAWMKPRVTCVESIMPPCCIILTVCDPTVSLRIHHRCQQQTTARPTAYYRMLTLLGSTDLCVAVRGPLMSVRLRSHSRITCLLPVPGGCIPLILRRQRVKMLETRRARCRRSRLPDVPRLDVVRVIMYSS